MQSHKRQLKASLYIDKNYGLFIYGSIKKRLLKSSTNGNVKPRLEFIKSIKPIRHFVLNIIGLGFIYSIIKITDYSLFPRGIPF